MGKTYGLIGLKKVNGQLYLFSEIDGIESQQKVNSSKIYLKVVLTDLPGQNRFYYAIRQQTFLAEGNPFVIENGFWKGPKIGLYSFNETVGGGMASFDWFHYNHEGPKNQK